MSMMNQKDQPTYYNIVILGSRVIAWSVPKSKLNKVMKDLAFTYTQKMEAVLVEDCK